MTTQPSPVRDWMTGSTLEKVQNDPGKGKADAERVGHSTPSSCKTAHTVSWIARAADSGATRPRQRERMQHAAGGRQLDVGRNAAGAGRQGRSPRSPA